MWEAAPGRMFALPECTPPTALHRRGVMLVLIATVMWSLAGLFARAVPHLDFGAILFARAGFGGLCGLARGRA